MFDFQRAHHKRARYNQDLYSFFSPLLPLVFWDQSYGNMIAWRSALCFVKVQTSSEMGTASFTTPAPLWHESPTIRRTLPQI